MLQILTGYNNGRREAHEAARVLNYELAVLVSFAHHDPKKMPKYKAASSTKVAPEDDEVNAARFRGAFIALALQSRRRG